ncbi:hypothetical protein HPPN135_05070 [Helicobacter pylori Puno135]|nr:hypothetical protein HPPN135_05070 [Helicobacter pylori Puno135]
MFKNMLLKALVKFTSPCRNHHLNGIKWRDLMLKELLQKQNLQKKGVK